MLFKDSFITDAGAELLARATAQEGRLVWTRAATSERNTDSLSVNEMNALDEEHFGNLSMTGAVTNVIVNDARNSVSVHCELSNEEADGTARTFGAWAKIDGDESDVLAIVARCGTGVVPVVINPIEQGVVRAFADFSLNISDKQVQAVGVIIGYYATATALQDEIAAREDLAGRVVTCHVADNETTGEAQNIYGEKTFITGICTSDIHDLDGSGIVTTGDIWSDAESDLGKDEWPWGDAYLTGVYTDSLYSKDYVDSSNIGYICIASNLYPLSGNTVDIGKTDNRFDRVFCNSLYATSSVYATNLYGVIRHPYIDNGNTKIPIGSIVLLLLAKSDSSSFTTLTTVYCGQELSSGGGTIGLETYDKIYIGQLRQTASTGELSVILDNATELTSGMKFSVITGGSNNGGMSTIPVLAIRTE